MSRPLKNLGSLALRSRSVRVAAAAAAAMTRRRLVLVFHRILRDGEASGGVVPSVPVRVFQEQLEQLLDVGDIVPLAAILDPGAGTRRPRFAITLDDDYGSHHDVVLPLLQGSDLPATFFLGGRSLHGLGSHWFEILDRLILSEGSRAVGRRLGLATNDIGKIAAACEREPRLQRIVEAEGGNDGAHLTADQISSLAAAGMTLGFHTLHHRTLTRLETTEATAALRDGRSELEDVVGTRIRYFAYPHGAADRSVATIVRAEGFEAACTGRPIAVTPRTGPFLIGRWEAGAISGHAFTARVLGHLWRTRA